MDVMQEFFTVWAEALEEHAKEKEYACEGCQEHKAQAGTISNIRIEDSEEDESAYLVFDLEMLCPACLEEARPELYAKDVLYHFQGGGFSLAESRPQTMNSAEDG